MRISRQFTDRIKPRRATRTAPANARKAHPAASPQAVAGNRLVCIGGACRQMAALPPDQRRQRELIKTDREPCGLGRHGDQPIGTSNVHGTDVAGGPAHVNGAARHTACGALASARQTARRVTRSLTPVAIYCCNVTAFSPVRPSVGGPFGARHGYGGGYSRAQCCGPAIDS